MLFLVLVTNRLLSVCSHPHQMAKLLAEWQFAITEYLSTLPIDWSWFGQYVPTIGPLKRPHFEPFEYIIIATLFIIAFIHGCIIRRRKINALTLRHRPKEFLKGNIGTLQSCLLVSFMRSLTVPCCS
jgi:hypothetical protein